MSCVLRMWSVKALGRGGRVDEKLSWCENDTVVDRCSVTASMDVEDVKELELENADLDSIRKNIDMDMDSMTKVVGVM